MVLKISFKHQRIQTKMHSYAIAGKHMSHMAVLTSFINRSHTRLLYFRSVCKNFIFDFTTTIFLFVKFLCAIVMSEDGTPCPKQKNDTLSGNKLRVSYHLHI